MSIFRVFTSVALSLALVSSSIAMPSEGSSLNVARELSFNPSGVALVPLKNFILPSKLAKRMTNAQRLARGLAPNPPQRRAFGQLKARASPTPTSDSSSSLPTPPVSSDSESAAQSSSASDSSSSSSSSAASADSSTPTSSSATPTPTPVCGTQSGYLKARYSSLTGQYTDGYVSNAMNSFGEWGFTHSTSSALAVSYDTCEGSPATFLVTNVQTNYPYIAGIVGISNTSPQDVISSTGYNYAYIGGTGSELPANLDPQPQGNSFSTATGSTTPADVETSIWAIDSTTGAVTVQWYNNDGSAPATTLIYVPSSTAFAVVGNLNQFANHFGTAYTATLTFVTSLPVAV